MFQTQCYYNQQKKLCEKMETQGNTRTRFLYQYNNTGHLLKVMRNGELEEKYAYNSKGQRGQQQRFHLRALARLSDGPLHYNPKGQLRKAGEISFAYNKHGAPSQRASAMGLASYFYGQDTMLNKAHLPGNITLRYEYSKNFPTCPLYKYRGHALAAKYVWQSPSFFSAARSAQRRIHAFRLLPFAFYK